MKRSLINSFIEKNWRQLDDRELSIKCGLPINAVRLRRERLGLKRERVYKSKIITEQVLTSKEKEKQLRKEEKKQVEDILKENVRLKRNLSTVEDLKFPQSHTIKKGHGKGGEATIVALASDWHVEEEVRPASVNGINKYTLDIARKRADHFFRTLMRLIEIERQNTKVKTLVLGLLGDFITGNIHEDCIRHLEENEALVFSQELLVSGLNYLLENSDLKIVCVCHSGNHARITKKQRTTTEHQNSQEWLMYRTLAHIFAKEKRLTFVIPEGYHSYLQVYDKTLRFHHGHNVNYKGGVGGPTIPINKSINEWNKLRRVDADFFGHFHQAIDGGNFICNGSMIGFNAFALSIKASPEPPTQMFVGIHSQYGLYITRRIRFPV